MKKKKLIIYGTGLVAEVVTFYFSTDTHYEVVGFTNAGEFITSTTFCDRPVVPFETIVENFSPNEFELFIGLGYNKTNQIRQARYIESKQKGYRCATYISSRAMYYGTPVGENSLILENNVIQPKVTIGNNVILWSGNHVGHHSIIEDHTFISSHVVVSGACTIGRNCFLGVNSTIRDNVKLSRFVVVGAGAIVTRDCEERTVVKPARSAQSIVSHDLI